MKEREREIWVGIGRKHKVLEIPRGRRIKTGHTQNFIFQNHELHLLQDIILTLIQIEQRLQKKCFILNFSYQNKVENVKNKNFNVVFAHNLLLNSS